MNKTNYKKYNRITNFLEAPFLQPNYILHAIGKEFEGQHIYHKRKLFGYC